MLSGCFKSYKIPSNPSEYEKVYYAKICEK